MKSTVIILLMALSFSAFSQQPWEAVEESTIQNRTTEEREIIPNAYTTYSLKIKDLRKVLSEAPMEDLQNSNKKGIKMDLPFPSGEMVEFDFVESPCMSPILSAKYPSIKSYRGVSATTNSVARIDFSNYGFRASIISPRGTIYIDPYFKDSDTYHLSYFTVDHEVSLEQLEKTCGVEDYIADKEEQKILKDSNVKIRPSRSLGEPVTKVTYRFALACTGRWGQQQGGTVDLVLPKMVTATNRLNSLLEPEMAMKFELIDDNDKLIFFLATEQYSSPQEGRVTLGENSGVINSFIDENSYDVGHVFTTECTDGVAGIANPGSVCSPGRKANGVSCIGSNPISSFVVSTMAHEIGHQFSAGHTWAACSTDSNNQFAPRSACEPGSGYSILSYSGLCSGANNTRPGIDLYHSCSLEQMKAFITIGNGAVCGEREVTDNHDPDAWIDMQGGFNIPIGTPFELTGDASDIDNDTLTYSWEQIDKKDELANLGDQTGPLFRFYEPTEDKTRTFPGMRYILRQQDWREERLPVISRNLTFRFVARDNNPLAGGVGWADIAFKASDTAGPFVVTEPSTTISTTPGQSLSVQWDVANTDNDVINCKTVDIYLSTNEGDSFDHLLLSKTPNDGSADVTIPNVRTVEGIIKVKGHKNAFFNVGEGVVRAGEPTAPTFFAEADIKAIDICLPDAFSTEITSESLLGFDEMVNLEVISELPAGATIDFGANPIPANGATTLSVDMNGVDVADIGLYEIIIQATAANADTSYIYLNVEAGNGFLQDFELMSPSSGTTGVASLPDFEWNGSDNADGYRLEVSTSPAFLRDDIVFTREAGLLTTIPGLFNLENSTLYYWRVIAYNNCFGEYPSEIFTFGANALNCKTFVSDDTPITIPSAGTPTVDIILDIEDMGTVTDLNVKKVKGNHTKVNTLRATMLSPAGTSAVLWEGECSNTPTIHAGFDDESAFPNDCPNVNGSKMQPREELAIFNGESIEGNWTLRIEDIQPANGGTISDFELELCSDRALDNPYVVNNEVMEVLTGSNNFVTKDDLLCQDDNNSASELLYTLVTIPQKGYLSINGDELNIGSQFTQQQLSNREVRYYHTGNTDTDDSFVFTLIDGEGGWIEKTIFIINMSQEGASSTDDVIESSSTLFNIYPNPTNDFITISKHENDNSSWSYSLYNTNGQLILKSTFYDKTKISLRDLSNGIYYLNLNDGQKTLYKKILKSE